MISTLILARLLVPEDFGIIAIVSLVIAFVERISETGAADYIIQKSEVTKDDLDTAWTLNLLLRVGVLLFVYFFAPLIALFYDDPRLTDATRVLAFVLLFGALVSPQIFLDQRERNYKRIFAVNLLTKMFSVAGTIALALHFRSYWALVFGQILAAGLKFIFSYIFMWYSPRICLRKVKDQIVFSQWLLLKSVFGWARSQIDTILVSTKFAESDLGGYHVSKYLAFIPGSDILTLGMSPLLASFSSVQSRKENLLYQIEFALIILFLIAYPLASLLFFSAFEINQIILGEKWIAYVNIFALLSLSCVTMPLVNFSTSILYVVKRPKEAFFFDVISMVLMVSILYFPSFSNLTHFVVAKVSFDLVAAHSYLVFSLRRAELQNWSRVIKIFLTSAILAILIGIFVKQVVVMDNVLLSGSVKILLYVMLWIMALKMIFLLYLKSTPIGFHIEYLQNRVLGRWAKFGIFKNQPRSFSL
ncbi:oligosaccharide flippase family protein [Thiorhodovibrio winogradskyi]|uniref:oligosaccharide flippase family protein n=1 Tax=Thiorhodovibrio winogradskyi TaxID=77007 RepID=UPI0038B468D0